MSIYNSADFDEQVLAHLARSPEVFRKAKKLKLEGDDFLTSYAAGIQVYKVIGETLLNLGVDPPIPQSLLEIELAEKFMHGEVTGVDETTVVELLTWMYTTELKPEYIINHLALYIKHRRLTKVQQNTAGTLDLYDEMNKVASSLEVDNSTSEIISLNPFDRPIFVDESNFRDAGFDGLTQAMGGFQPEECSLILGCSGAGKTSVAINIASAIAQNYNVLYLSLEEPTEHLVQRFYANKFGLHYTKLRYGNQEEKMLLQTAFNDLTAPERAAMRRLKIADARKQCPITFKAIITLLESYAADNFIVDTLIIDQMDYMAPATYNKGRDGKWENYEAISFECDELSNYKIQGRHPISVIVLHQLKGNPKWRFSYDDITGFKGIVKPFDNAIAIGKVPDTDHINLQSLKVRHSAPFCLTYRANFANMTFAAEKFIYDEEADSKQKGSKYQRKKKETFDEKEARLLQASRELRE